MPVYLKDIHDFQQLEQFQSVLIVPCRFCPAASLALRNNEPYFEFFRHMLQTAAYERYIVCMRTRRRRKQLMKRAKNYDALVVLGCEAAVQTILDSVDTESFQVVQGMRTEGIMSILPRFNWPGSITLQLNSITPLLHQKQGSEPWVRL